MTTIHTLEQRLRAVESRLADVEDGYGQTLYRLDRRTVALELGMERLLAHFNLPAPNESDVDARLDKQ